MPRPPATVALLALAVGCAPQPEDKASGKASGSTAETCAKGSLSTQTAGKLTIATDEPAYEPWFKDDKPDQRQGLRVGGRVRRRQAARLRHGRGRLGRRVPFNKAFAPGAKNFDFDINQVSISAERKKAVDFSSGYYDVRQAVIALKGSKAATATSSPTSRTRSSAPRSARPAWTRSTTWSQPTPEPARLRRNNDQCQAR